MSDSKSLHDLMYSGRKFGATTYSYSARSIQAVDADSESGKVVVTVRNDKTGELVMNEKMDAKDVAENGLPLPSLDELHNQKS